MTKPSIPSDLSSRIKIMTWPKGQVIHRIHPVAYGADQFNPSGAGNARFSPIRDTTGAIIPTIYGGSEFDCAAMETAFHDIPHAVGLKTLRKSKIANLVYSVIVNLDDLKLVDLSSIALHKFGLKRTDIIDTPASEYDYSRSWAEAFHAQCPDIEGLHWQSKQADHAQAIVLFGDRVTSGKLTVQRNALEILTSPTYSDVLRLANAIDVNLV